MPKIKAPRVVVSALIKKGNKYLLIKEKLENDKEVWIIPGGGVDFGESLEEALLREMKEELGIDIKIQKFLKFQQAIFPNFNYHTIIFFFLAEPLSAKLLLEDKILDAGFFTQSQIKKLDLVESAQELFQDFF